MIKRKVVSCVIKKKPMALFLSGETGLNFKTPGCITCFSCGDCLNVLWLRKPKYKMDKGTIYARGI